MIVNYETIKAAFEGWQALYKEQYSKAEPQWPKIAMLMPSTGYQETYDWLGGLPAVVEWLGERTLNQIKGYKFTLTNKLYAPPAIEVDRSQFEDDKLGLINPRVQELGLSMKMHPDKLIMDLLTNGFATAGPDGSYFFVATHSESGTNQSNLSTAVLSIDAVEAGIAAMMGFTDDNGNKLGIMPDTLVVPPQLYMSALRIVSSTTIVPSGLASTSALTTIGTSNVLSTMGLQVVTSPYLSGDATDWFLLATKYPIRPLILQMRREPEFTAITDPTSSEVFRRNKFLFGADGRYTVGYGLWQLAYGSHQ